MWIIYLKELAELEVLANENAVIIGFIKGVKVFGYTEKYNSKGFI
jgi:hypothetical protein